MDGSKPSLERASGRARMLDSSMLRKIVVGVLGGVVALVSACGSETPPSQFGTSSGNDGDAGSSSGILGRADAGPPPPAVECNKMDIVFVIDNSQSMEQEQTNLGKNFPEFIKVINEYKTEKGQLLDYRVAITSTDDGVDRGKFRKGRGQGPDQSCDPGPNNNPWLVRADANIAENFACRAQLGTLGSNVERPLESARLAVTDRIADGTNMKDGTESFIRADALLAFVIITDEDEGGADNSSPPPAPLKDTSMYAGDFDNVKAGLRGRWAAAAIAGDRGCVSALGDAADAVRLKRFINTVGKNGVFSSICEGDLTKGLKDALTTFTQACKEFPGVIK
jgi:hypothetical protein